MDATTTDAAPSTPPPEPAESDGLSDTAAAVWRDLRAVLVERGRLLTLEARLAGLTFVQLVMYGVLVAVLVVTAWLGIVAGVVIALVYAGLHWALGLALGVIANLAVAALLVRGMLTLIGRLDLQATMRRLKGRTEP